MVLWFLDRTLVFEDRLIYRRVSHLYFALLHMRDCIYDIYLQNDEMQLKGVIKKDINNIDFFIIKYQAKYPPANLPNYVQSFKNFAGLSRSELTSSVISFYITGEKEDIWWIGYNLSPPHLKGRFGIDRASNAAKKRIEEKAQYYTFLYGSTAIDSPPESDDQKYLYKMQDSVVWMRISSFNDFFKISNNTGEL